MVEDLRLPNLIYIQEAVPFILGHGPLGRGINNSTSFDVFFNAHMPFVMFAGFMLLFITKRKGMGLLKAAWLLVFFVNAAQMLDILCKVGELLLQTSGVVPEEVFYLKLITVAIIFRVFWLYMAYRNLKWLESFTTLKHQPGINALPMPVIAGKGQRLGNMVTDYCCTFILVAHIGDVFDEYLIAMLAAVGVVEHISFLARVLLVAAIVFTTYFIFFEAWWGTTLGKALTGTIVSSKHGGKLPVKNVVQRTLLRLLPFEWFSFLGKRGWHDAFSNSYVYRTIYTPNGNDIEQEVEQIGNEPAQ